MKNTTKNTSSIKLLRSILLVSIFFISTYAYNQCDITVNVFSTGAGNQTTWELTDNNGLVVLNGGPYSSPYNDTQTLNAANNGPYSLVINSASGNNTPDYTVTMYNSIFHSGTATPNQITTINNISCPATPTCPTINSPSASLINTSSVALSWTPGGNETEWNIEYGPQGFTLGTGTNVNTTNNPLNITGLTLNETYDFYIQSVCGTNDEGFWHAPISFYNGYCAPSHNAQTEWLSTFETTDAFQNIQYNASAFPNNGWEILNDTIKQFVGEDLNFNLAYHQSSTNTIAAWVDWNDDLVFDPVNELIYMNYSTNTQSTGSLNITPATPVGVYNVRARATFGNQTSSLTPCNNMDWGSAIDFKIEILPAPSCPRPTSIQAINITDTSADLNWILGGNETSWDLRIDTSGFNVQNNAGQIVNNNNFNATNLTPNTSYDVYVRGICSPGDTSIWRGPYTFQTNCSTFSAPFIETFDGNAWISGIGNNNENSEISACWDRNPGANNTFHWGTRTGATGNAQNSGPGQDVSGNGNYLYTLSDFGNQGDEAIFDSPEIDLSTINDPNLKFSYFMRGNQINSLNVFISNDNGVNWNPLLTISGSQQSSINDPWEDTTINLSTYTNDIVKIRFSNIKNSTGLNEIAIDEFKILACAPNSGTDGSIDVCSIDGNINLSQVVNLNTNIGNWIFPQNQNAIVNNETFDFSNLSPNTYEIYYITEGACQNDTVTAFITVFDENNAGNPGELTKCTNEPFDLVTGLNGSVNLGGEWYDPAFNLLNNSQVAGINIPGAYNFTYVVNNMVCPADSQNVIVSIEICSGTPDLSTADNDGFSELTIYPNPSNNEITIENIPTTFKLKSINIIDASGRNIKSIQAQEAATKIKIMTSDLESGVYYIQMSNSTEVKVRKFVKL